MSIGLLGQKIGMTSVYDANGRMRPVTVIAAGDNVLVRRITAENDGYSAIKVGFDAQKESRVNKSLLGEFKAAGSEPKKLMKEFRLPADAPEGVVKVVASSSADYWQAQGRVGAAPPRPAAGPSSPPRPLRRRGGRSTHHTRSGRSW